MELFFTFLIAFFFSFIGSIPPGTMNLSIIQLGLEQKINVAWRFAIGSTLFEYPYAWMAVKFESLITSSPMITENFQLITGVVMLTLGILNLLSSRRPSKIYQRFSDSGFRRGLILGILNPLALPYWIAMTAYVKNQGWIDLSSELEIQSYLMGVVAGGITVLLVFAYLAKNVVKYFQQNTILKRIPGYTLLLLGVYALMQYFF
jgi:threonine/homoserine/homoserine lactone efflux protein